jgi:NADPH:quinone reductase-like Zn-dependent oxidoreductase
VPDRERSAPVRPGTMRAWVFDRYGSPERLELRDVPFPRFRDGREVLVRVRASSVNPLDRHALHPPIFLRGRGGVLRPKEGRLGSDLAGVVELVGTKVEEFHVGDEVFGVGRGAFAEYAVADASQLALKPSNTAFEQAAAVPIAGVTALQALRDVGHLQAGQHVLVNGASGGVGTFAVQIARSLGGRVSSVCSPANVEWNRAQGVERVFDYTREDFTAVGQKWDLILDTQLNHSLAGYRRALNPHGLLVMVGAGAGSAGRIVARLLGKSVGSRIVGPRSKFFVASIKKDPLRALADLLAGGTLLPRIDRSIPLEQVPAAIQSLIEGHARGKIVVTI